MGGKVLPDQKRTGTRARQQGPGRVLGDVRMPLDRRQAGRPDLPDALRRTLDRIDRRTLAAVSRFAASRLGAMGGVEGE